MYRVWIGTMNSGEAEFDMCLAAIKSQKGVKITHHLINDMSEFDAHNALYDAWNVAKNEHDIFVKVDADTVLVDDNIISKICNKFFDNELDAMQVYLHDYFTDGYIAGLNAYSTHLQFTKTENRLCPDRGMTSQYRKAMYGDQLLDIAPAGRHCIDPHKLQAFHFGLHRMLKNQRQNMQRVFNVWQTIGGDGRAYALIGAMASSMLATSFDYNNLTLQSFVNSIELNDDTRSKIRLFGSSL